MKVTILFPVISIVVGSFSLTSCEKDLNESKESETLSVASQPNHPVIRAYKDTFDTWYQLVPDIAAGWDPSNPTPYLAWYPGGGDGNATHLGNAKIYFNQYVPFDPPNFSSVSAPVTMFFSNELAAAGITGVPSEVNSIVYDRKGNSVWFHLTSNSTIPVGPTRIEFTSTADIVGGTGKFSGATGEVSLNGFFNPQNQQDASVWSKGYIKY